MRSQAIIVKTMVALRRSAIPAHLRINPALTMDPAKLA
jgi:hypothetical protein